jgi:ectoine hydroxylase-related dioxygenase (phytanoyl-CoA dioxygenase family)
MLSSGQVSAFWRDGYLAVPGVVASAALDALRRAVDHCLDGRSRPDLRADLEDYYVMWDTNAEEQERRSRIRVMMHLCHTRSEFRSRALDPFVVTAVQRLVGERVAVFTDLLFNKPPFCGREVALHQDHAYYRFIDPPPLVTCWLALDDADGSNGCLEFLPGSHGRLLDHRTTGKQQAYEIDPVDLQGASLQAVPLRAGGVIFHHSLVVHRSAENESARERRGLATLYVPTSACIEVGAFPFAPLATA